MRYVALLALALVILGIMYLIVMSREWYAEPLADLHTVDTLRIESTTVAYDTLVIERPDIEARLLTIESRLPECSFMAINKASYTCRK